MFNHLVCNNFQERLTCGLDEVHVWRVSTVDQLPHLENLMRFLNMDELSRLNRLVIPIERNQYIVCRATLRLILSRYLDINPEKICFSYDTKGKMQLQKKLNLLDIRFSLSHSGNMALYSVSLKKENGVDVEWIRNDLASHWIAERFFPADEVKYLRQLKGVSFIEGFFQCWTRMEAYMKALGQGIAGAGKVTNYDRLSWSLYNLNLGKGYTGSLVVQGHDHRIIYYDLPC
jgi:4'-phosphopantetheinyl transferase